MEVVCLQVFTALYKSLQELIQVHGIEGVKVEALPKLGYGVISDNQLIAAGFIRLMEGGEFGMLDGYITNPKFSPKQRNQALDLLTQKMINVAKDNQLKKIFAFTKEGCILTRAKNHGFTHLPHALMVYDTIEEV